MKAISITLLAGAMAAAVACSSSSTSPSASIAGTYVLSSVNGESLPAIVTNAGDTAVVVTDTLALNSSNGYTRHAVDTLRSGGNAPTLYSHVSSGTYARSGTSITFTDGVTDSSATGTIANNAITISSVENGFSVTGVFTKQ